MRADDSRCPPLGVLTYWMQDELVAGAVSTFVVVTNLKAKQSESSEARSPGEAISRQCGVRCRRWVGTCGSAHVSVLASLLEEGEEIGASLPEAARTMFLVMTGQLEQLNDQVALLDKEIAKRAREEEAARRLMTIPGIGPITATAQLALAPPVEGFARGRDFAAWIGLTPRQNSSGGKERLGSITKAGSTYLRELLVVGAMAVVRQAKQGSPKWSWVARLMERKTPKVAAVALANKNARIVWSMLATGETYREAGLAAA
jgi:transposase